MAQEAPTKQYIMVAELLLVAVCCPVVKEVTILALAAMAVNPAVPRDKDILKPVVNITTVQERAKADSIHMEETKRDIPALMVNTSMVEPEI